MQVRHTQDAIDGVTSRSAAVVNSGSTQLVNTPSTETVKRFLVARKTVENFAGMRVCVAAEPVAAPTRDNGLRAKKFQRSEKRQRDARDSLP
jgi:hypothetical protein